MQGGWTSPAVFEMINWSARGRAGLRLSEDKHLTIFKLEWNILATMQHRSKFDQGIDN
jgi:hypothetical protein